MRSSTMVHVMLDHYSEDGVAATARRSYRDDGSAVYFLSLEARGVDVTFSGTKQVLHSLLTAFVETLAEVVEAPPVEGMSAGQVVRADVHAEQAVLV
jgi:hypothetical protein